MDYTNSQNSNENTNTYLRIYSPEACFENGVKVCVQCSCTCYTKNKEEKSFHFVQDFAGNWDRNTAVINILDSLVAQYVRIRPMEWNGNISMRFEILGCQSKTMTLAINLGIAKQLVQQINTRITLFLRRIDSPNVYNTFKRSAM